MSADWRVVTIDELKSNDKGAIAIGPFGSRMKSDCYVANGIPVIRGTNITGGPSFEGEFVFITRDKADELGSCNVYKNDLVFPHRGSIGEVGIILSDERYVISSSLMKLTCDQKKANPKFLYYFFKSKHGRHELLKNASQVGTPGIGQPLASLRSISLNLPPLETQNRISDVLTSLDQKILLNTQTNQTLESIAQAIFKSWFVDFDPVKAKIAAKERWYAMQSTSESASPVCYADEAVLPDLETYTNLAAMCAISGKNETELAQLQQQNPGQYQQLVETAALFPSAMVDSELGEIPDGWEVKIVESLLDLAYGKSLGKTERIDGNIPVYGSGGLTGWHNQSLVDGPGIIVGRKGTVGSIFWEKNSFFPIDTVFYVVPKEGIPLVYTYYLLQILGLENMNTDAAVPGLNRNNVYRLETVLSSSELIKRFSKLVWSLRNQIDSLTAQSIQLSQLRDSLLLKLLSGEIDLTNIQSEVA